MASESIAHSAFSLMGYIDSKPIRAWGIIVKYTMYNNQLSLIQWKFNKFLDEKKDEARIRDKFRCTVTPKNKVLRCAGP